MHDGPDKNKTVNDTKRIEYHKSHVEQTQIAVDDGIMYDILLGLLWIPLSGQKDIVKDLV